MRSHASAFVLLAVLIAHGHSTPVPQDSQPAAAPSPAEQILAAGKKFIEEAKTNSENSKKAIEANEKVADFINNAAKIIEEKLTKHEKKIAEKLKEIRPEEPEEPEEPKQPAANPKAEEINAKNEDRSSEEKDEEESDKESKSDDDKSDEKSDAKEDESNSSEETETEIVTEVVTEIIEEAGTTIVYEEEDETLCTTEAPSSAA